MADLTNHQQKKPTPRPGSQSSNYSRAYPPHPKSETAYSRYIATSRACACPFQTPCSCFSIILSRKPTFHSRILPSLIIISPARPVSSVPGIPTLLQVVSRMYESRILGMSDFRGGELGGARGEVGWCIRVELITPALCRREEGITDTRGYDG